MNCHCQSCGWTGPESELACDLSEIPDLSERLDPGGEVPAGECPKCNALAYLVKESAAVPPPGGAELPLRLLNECPDLPDDFHVGSPDGIESFRQGFLRWQARVAAALQSAAVRPAPSPSPLVEPGERAGVRGGQDGFWLVSHSHRHGQNNYLFDHQPNRDEAITFLGDRWEPDRDEFIYIEPIDLESGTAIPAPAPLPPRIVICLQGGIVNDILGDAPVEVAIVDYDTDGADPDDDKIVAIDQGDGTETDAFARIEDAHLNLTRVNEIFASFE